MSLVEAAKSRDPFANLAAQTYTHATCNGDTLWGRNNCHQPGQKCVQDINIRKTEYTLQILHGPLFNSKILCASYRIVHSCSQSMRCRTELQSGHRHWERANAGRAVFCLAASARAFRPDNNVRHVSVAPSKRQTAHGLFGILDRPRQKALCQEGG